MSTDAKDKRWGGHIPWFLRHQDYTGAGNYLLFFERVSHRVFQLLFYNEASIQNLMHFGSILESKSLQRYRFVFKSEYGISNSAYSVRDYFSPATITKEMEPYFYNDVEELRLREFYKKIRTISMGGRGGGIRIGIDPHSQKLYDKYKEMETQAKETRARRQERYYQPLFIQRLGVLEVLLRILPKDTHGFTDFVQDLRSFLAEANIMLDINIDTLSIDLIDEPLLQRAVIDVLLPRLKSRYPERAKDLVGAYHDMLKGKDFDDIFINSFKALEEIARSITNDKSFEFEAKYLSKYFPKLHKTIHATIMKLDAHRGDKGGHGKTSPEPHEMRYLLFSICNTALLLLDYNP